MTLTLQPGPRNPTDPADQQSGDKSTTDTQPANADNPAPDEETVDTAPDESGADPTAAPADTAAASSTAGLDDTDASASNTAEPHAL